MSSFAKRNIMVYFRDRLSIFFSLLGVLIVVGLYALFLGDNLANSMNMLPNGKLLVNAWLAAGLCAITPVSTALGAMGAIVADRERDADKDFLSSPLPRRELAGGYLLGGLSTSCLMGMLMLVLGGIWLMTSDAALPGFSTLAALVGVQILSGINGSCMAFLIVSFLRTNSAYAAASTVTGTLLGFLTGIYMPIGSLPASMQAVVKIFPATHAASLTRWLLLQGPADAAFDGLPTSVIDEIYLSMGVRLQAGEALFPLWGSVLVLAGSAALFFALSVLVYGKKKQ